MNICINLLHVDIDKNLVLNPLGKIASVFLVKVDTLPKSNNLLIPGHRFQNFYPWLSRKKIQSRTSSQNTYGVLQSQPQLSQVTFPWKWFSKKKKTEPSADHLYFLLNKELLKELVWVLEYFQCFPCFALENQQN